MIVSSAPVRICDIGGWTDTRFGGPGRVFHVAVGPQVEATIAPADGPTPVRVRLDSFGAEYSVRPGEPRQARYPLVEAAIDMLPPPSDQPVEVTVRAQLPPGCGTGTSASVAVALLGALAAARGEQLSADEAARAAHRLEVDILGSESGVQDQIAAAHGGVNFIEIDDYPTWRVHPLPEWPDLGPQFTLVYLGRGHDSSAVHRQVVMRSSRREAETRSAMGRLRAAAQDARRSFDSRDLAGLGAAMIANTDAQRSLHQELVGADAELVIDAFAAAGALGWKVNGAGGDGGSLTILGAPRVPVDLEARFEVLPVRLSGEGLSVAGSL